MSIESWTHVTVHMKKYCTQLLRSMLIFEVISVERFHGNSRPVLVHFPIKIFGKFSILNGISSILHNKRLTFVILLILKSSLHIQYLCSSVQNAFLVRFV